MPRLKDRLAFVFCITPLTAACAVTALSLAACGGDSSATSDPPPTAKTIVDVWFFDEGEKRQFCKEYAQGPELALKQFEDGFEELGGGYPSASAVFDEAASRC